MATTCYNILQQRERIDMFIIARKHITPHRMLYRTRIVVESCSYRNCNRPITGTAHRTAPMLTTFKPMHLLSSLHAFVQVVSRSVQHLALPLTHDLVASFMSFIRRPNTGPLFHVCTLRLAGSTGRLPLFAVVCA